VIQNYKIILNYGGLSSKTTMIIEEDKVSLKVSKDKTIIILYADIERINFDAMHNLRLFVKEKEYLIISDEIDEIANMLLSIMNNNSKSSKNTENIKPLYQKIVYGILAAFILFIVGGFTYNTIHNLYQSKKYDNNTTGTEIKGEILIYECIDSTIQYYATERKGYDYVGKRKLAECGFEYANIWVKNGYEIYTEKDGGINYRKSSGY
jgi:hypothetical protein